MAGLTPYFNGWHCSSESLVLAKGWPGRRDPADGGKVGTPWTNTGCGPPLKGWNLWGQTVDFSGRSGPAAWPQESLPRGFQRDSGVRQVVNSGCRYNLLPFIGLEVEPICSAVGRAELSSSLRHIWGRSPLPLSATSETLRRKPGGEHLKTSLFLLYHFSFSLTLCHAASPG